MSDIEVSYGQVREARRVYFKKHPDHVGRDILTRELTEEMLRAAWLEAAIEHTAKLRNAEHDHEDAEPNPTP